MCQHTIAARSKLKNFAPKILLCAQLGVLSVRNANIVFGGTAEELGILNFEFLLRQAAKPSGELFSASPAILNYSVVNYSRQGKHRRLWRLAVATQPPIAAPPQSAPCPDGTRIYLKPTASSEGAPLWVSKDAHTLSWFREAGPMYCPQYHSDCVSPASRNC